MRGIKILQQYFALKMQGSLCAGGGGGGGGGVFAGQYGTCTDSSYYTANMNEKTEKAPCLAMMPYGVIGEERVK